MNAFFVHVFEVIVLSITHLVELLHELKTAVECRFLRLNHTLIQTAPEVAIEDAEVNEVLREARTSDDPEKTEAFEALEKIKSSPVNQEESREDKDLKHSEYPDSLEETGGQKSPGEPFVGESETEKFEEKEPEPAKPEAFEESEESSSSRGSDSSDSSEESESPDESESSEESDFSEESEEDDWEIV